MGAARGLMLVLDTAVARALHPGAHDVNVRAAFLHMLGDARSSVGGVVAGIVILLTGAIIWNPVVSLLIGVFILWWSWSIIRETVGILLESAPAGVDLRALARDVEAVSGVANIHDLHAWSLSSDVQALSAHIAFANQDEASPADIRDVLAHVRMVLRDRYGIDHTTLETHCQDEAAADEGLCCGLSPTCLTRDHHVHTH